MGGTRDNPPVCTCCPPPARLAADKIAATLGLDPRTDVRDSKIWVRPEFLPGA